MNVRAMFLALALIGCASSEPFASSEDAPGPTVASPVTGWVLVDQPDHGGYEASLYEFGARGTVRLDSTWVSFGGAYQRADASIATVSANDTDCEFGGRYTSLSPTRIELDGVCSDGRTRTIELEMLASVDNPERFGLEIISVGGEPGWTHEGFSWSLRRCADRASCLDFLPPQLVASPPPAATTPTCAELSINLVAEQDRVHLQVSGTRYVARAVPIVARVGQQAVQQLVLSDDAINGTLAEMPKPGDVIEIARADGTERLVCPIE